MLREITERPEAIEVRVAQPVDAEVEAIVGKTYRLLHDPEAYAAMARPVNPYGDGCAAERITNALLDYV